VPRWAADLAVVFLAVSLGGWAAWGAVDGGVALAGAHGTDAEWATWWAGEVLRRLDGLITAPSTWSPAGSPFYATLPGPLGPFLAAILGLAVGQGAATAAWLAAAVAGSAVAAYAGARMLSAGTAGSLLAAVAFATSTGIAQAVSEGLAWRAAAWFVPLFLAASWRLAGSLDGGADVSEAAAFAVGAALIDWSTGAGCLGAILAMAAWWLLRPDRGVVLARVVAVVMIAGVVLAVVAAPIYAAGWSSFVEVLDWADMAAAIGPMEWGLAGLAMCVPRSRPWVVVAAAAWGSTSVQHPRGIELVFHGALALGGAVALGAWPRWRRVVQVLAVVGAGVAAAGQLPRATWQALPPPRLPVGAEPGAVMNLPMSRKLRQDDRLVQVQEGRDVLVGTGRPPAEWGALVAREPVLRAIDSAERGERSQPLQPGDLVALYGAGFRWITVQPSTPTAVVRRYEEILSPALGGGGPPWSVEKAVIAARAAEDARRHASAPTDAAKAAAARLAAEKEAADRATEERKERAKAEIQRAEAQRIEQQERARKAGRGL
jgi:hypothetical protein